METGKNRLFPPAPWGWLAPAVLVTAFVAATGSLFWLLQSRQFLDHRNDLVQAVDSAARQIRSHLQSDREYLWLLAEEMERGRLDARSFQIRASHYVADHPGLINMMWADEDFVIRWTAPHEPNKQVVGLTLRLAEPGRASRLARDSRAAVYTRPLVAIQGQPSFEVYVPIFRGKWFLGTFGGVYSAAGILGQSIPPSVGAEFRATILDGSGDPVATLSTPGRRVDDRLVETRSLASTGLDVSLRLGRYRTGPGWGVTILSLLSLGLAAGVGLSLWAQGREIAERKRTEAALKKSEQRFRDVAEAASDWIWETDADHRFTYLSERFQEMAGLPPERAIGRLRRELFACHVADPQRFENHFRAIEEHVSFQDLEFQWVLPDGTVRLFRSSGKPVFDADGVFQGYRGVGTDVTERKRFEEALRESEEKYRGLVEASRHGIQETDTDGNILFANPANHRMLGYADGELIGMNLRDLTPEGERSWVPSRIAATVDDQSDPGPRLNRNLTKDGRVIDVEIDWTYKRDTEGKAVGFISVLTDVTERLRADQELRVAKENAERANTAKSRFIAAASHDLRQPLQALNMFVNVLAEGDHDARTRDVIDRIVGSMEALEGLLNALLDISKLDAGLIVPETVDFPINQLIGQLHEEFRQLAEAKGLRLRVVPSRLFVHSDPVLIERILRNLLANALRYTERGGILVGCRRRRDSLRIEVRDTGIGIPQDQLTKIFHEFHQVDNEAGNRHEGLGLGLAIVDRLASLLGHRIDVSSVPGKGSVFAVEVRLASPAIAERKPGPDPVPADAGDALILVIDDEQSILEAMRLQFENWGYRVVTAASCEEALDNLAGEDRTPDLILADYRLRHGETGSGAIRTIRRRLAEDFPGILITGDTAPERLREATESGFDMVHKPIHPTKLRQAVATAIETRRRNRDPGRKGRRG